MSKVLSHEENRKKVCASCGNKLIFRNKNSDNFLISNKTKDLIKKYLNENFSLAEEKYPISICVTCRLNLFEHEKGINKRPLPIMPNYMKT